MTDNKEREALYLAAINCPHEIEATRIVLHYDPTKPGKNALAQLGDRLAKAAQQVPPGFALVPIDITETMIRAWFDTEPGEHDYSGNSGPYFNPRYRAMLAAAPTPLAPPVESPAVALNVPVPFDVNEARAQGRSEALAMLLDVDPDTFCGEYIVDGGSLPSGDRSEDWDADKLRELFRTDDTAYSLIQVAKDEYWHNLGLREEAERMKAASAPPPAVAARDLTNDEIKRAWRKSMLSEAGGDFLPAFRAVIAADRALRSPAVAALTDEQHDAMQRAFEGSSLYFGGEQPGERVANWRVWTIAWKAALAHTAAQPQMTDAARDVPFEITPDIAADWARRQDVAHVLTSFGTQRDAIEDARTLHLAEIERIDRAATGGSDA